MHPRTTAAIGALAVLLLGTSDCRPEPPPPSNRIICANGNEIVFRESGHHTIHTPACDYPVTAYGKSGVRYELRTHHPANEHGLDRPDQLDWKFIDTYGFLDHMGWRFSWSASPWGARVPVDIPAEVPAIAIINGADTIAQITKYDQGECYMAIPWRTEGYDNWGGGYFDLPVLDPASAGFLADVYDAGGLHQLVLDEFNDGFVRADSTFTEIANRVWVWDWESELRVDYDLPTQLFQRELPGDPGDIEMCIRAYARFDGGLNYVPFDGVEALAFIATLGLPRLFHILDCPDGRRVAMNMCLSFGVTGPEDGVFAYGTENVPIASLDLDGSWDLHSDPMTPFIPWEQQLAVRGFNFVEMEGYPWIRPGCNNQVGTIEDNIEAMLDGGIGAGFQAILQEFNQRFPWPIEDVFETGEGVTIKICDTPESCDPAHYAAAQSIGLCGNTRRVQPGSAEALREIGLSAYPEAPPCIPCEGGPFQCPCGSCKCVFY